MTSKIFFNQLQISSFTCIFVVSLTVATASPIANSQLSEYQECSDGLDTETLGDNLTAQERIALMDEHFEAEISDTDRCETSQSGGSSSGANGGGGGGGAGGGAGAGSYGANSTNNSQASPNALEANERSIAVNSEMHPSSNTTDSETSSAAPGTTGNNGRDHEALATADNKKALAQSILERAEEEDDPVVKAALMKRYKELTQ